MRQFCRVGSEGLWLQREVSAAGSIASTCRPSGNSNFPKIKHNPAVSRRNSGDFCGFDSIGATQFGGCGGGDGRLRGRVSPEFT
ncbi:MAG TPA: hypothetical protein DC058_03730 [Planctomycetaceae bacterium]|nr:hypothetical protein [Planctomycetaceae bacterium]HBC60313.1 hypothetical protein [Planctomycetaceae bacterium]